MIGIVRFLPGDGGTGAGRPGRTWLPINTVVDGGHCAKTGLGLNEDSWTRPSVTASARSAERRPAVPREGDNRGVLARGPMRSGRRA